MSETKCVNELELKLAVPDRAMLGALPAVLEESGCSVRELGVRTVHDRYLDTQDWRLYRAGFGCRLRTQDGSAAVLTLKELTKLEDGWAERLEWEERLPELVAPLPGPLPGKEIASRFAPALAGKPLDEVVKLVKKQQAFEVTDDAVTIHVTVDRVETGDKLFSEIELELITGDRERFHALAEDVRIRLNLSPSTADKYSLALNMSGITPPERNGGIKLDFTPEDCFVEAAYRVMRLHYARFLWHEPGTRLGMDPEHLHDMRVATRRLLAALWVFSSAFSAERVAALKRELKWVAKTLGPVRDLDIALKRIEEEAQALPAEEKKAIAVYRDYLIKQREIAQARVPAALDSERFTHLKASLDNFLCQVQPSAQSDASGAAFNAAHAAPTAASPAVDDAPAAASPADHVAPDAVSPSVDAAPAAASPASHAESAAPDDDLSKPHAAVCASSCEPRVVPAADLPADQTAQGSPDAASPADHVFPDAASPAAQVAPRVFLANLSTIREEAKNLSFSSSDQAMHAFRRKCKRIRYQAEFFTPLYGKPAKKIAAQFVAMQDALGAHQDTVVSNQILAEFMVRHLRPRDDGGQLYMALGRITAQRALSLQKQRDDFFKSWKRFDRKKNYARLKKRMKLIGAGGK